MVITDWGVKPGPFTSSKTGEATAVAMAGLTDAIVGSGFIRLIVAERLPISGMFEAIMVTGVATAVKGALYSPLSVIVPKSVLPPTIPFTDHVVPADGWLTLNCWLSPARTMLFCGINSGAVRTPQPTLTEMVAKKTNNIAACCGYLRGDSNSIQGVLTIVSDRRTFKLAH
jgi:hypothetical protein